MEWKQRVSSAVCFITALPCKHCIPRSSPDRTPTMPGFFTRGNMSSSDDDDSSSDEESLISSDDEQPKVDGAAKPAGAKQDMRKMFLKKDAGGSSDSSSDEDSDEDSDASDDEGPVKPVSCAWFLHPFPG